MGHCYTQPEEIDRILMDESRDPPADAPRIAGVSRTPGEGCSPLLQHAAPGRASWHSVSLHLGE